MKEITFSVPEILVKLSKILKSEGYNLDQKLSEEMFADTYVKNGFAVMLNFKKLNK